MDDLSVALKEAATVTPSFDSSQVRAVVQRRRRRHRRILGAGAAVFVVATAILTVVYANGERGGSEVQVATEAPPVAETAAPVAALQVVTNVVDAGNGPRLCLISTADRSTCEGPAVVGLDWAQIPWAQRDGTVTSARMLLVGQWDTPSQSFVVGSPPTDGSLHEASSPELRPIWNEGTTDPGPSCPAPANGWPAIANVNERSKDDAAVWLNGRSDIAAVWQSWIGEPPNFVLNVRVAEGGDLAAVETGVRERFAGNLCLTTGGASRESLRDSLSRLTADSTDRNIAAASVLEIPGRIRLVVWFAPPDLQAAMDAEFGPGVVEIVQLLEPAT